MNPYVMVMVVVSATTCPYDSASWHRGTALNIAQDVYKAKKGNLSLCLTTHFAMSMYGGCGSAFT
jgi:hypothetical protein